MTVDNPGFMTLNNDNASPIRFGLRPERGSDRCSRVRVPGAVVLHSWGGDPLPADLQKRLTKVFD